MTPKTESLNGSIQKIPGISDSPGLKNESTNLVAKVKSDCFELLSSYVDGEATPAERRQVNQWLDRDPEIKNLYLHLLRIRQNLQQMPVPESTQPVSETVDRFFWLLGKRRRQTLAKVGGSAIAALCIAAVAGLIPGMPSVRQLAKSLDSNQDSQQLTIALNRPIVPIPKAAVTVPMKQPEQPLSSTRRQAFDLIYKDE
jgi:anti-sigma factor RsiW